MHGEVWTSRTRGVETVARYVLGILSIPIGS